VHSEWRSGMIIFAILWLYVIVAVMIDLVTNISNSVLNFEYEFTQWDYLILA
ncbi:34404_t:CDS:1, partial [Racocetra persica]